ncbi:sulfotransferase family protein [Sphingomonas immobilis]|uniref:Sulfotransferase n=1 Tax=Sphingomonas immobilis TaxID=3063997 RepID=A0ABT9A199_9SPHN|nr:sulfotransferase [Sphingomonas sp. CA1-15]MDO7843612.1 sulfotransferase [Sphingomonas sp. CA1-15]
MALSVEDVLQRAEAATGLTNWGTDQAFRVGLAELLGAAATANLPAMGSAALERQIVDLLSIRLRFVEDERLHPEIVAQTIDRPLILTGLPRTGTTILHDLCALDPAGRAPLEWESSRPWPAPEAATYTTDPRIAECQAEIDARLEAMPILRSMHPWGATLPADCLSFLSLSFVCTRFVASFYVPEYSHWLSVTKPEGVYRTHKRALQQLQWRGPQGRWILKEPQHLLDMEQLVGVYPDSCIVQTHRDPVRTIVSVASLIWTIQSMLRPDIDKKETGRLALELFGAHLERGTIARQDKAIDNRVIDIAYRDTVLNPVGTVERIYDHFNLPFSSEHADRIKHHIAENPQGKHGAHKYTPEEFGLDPATLKGLMPEYRHRFADLLEEPAR